MSRDIDADTKWTVLKLAFNRRHEQTEAAFTAIMTDYVIAELVGDASA